MIRVYLTLISNQVVPLNLEGMHYGCKLRIMGWVILLMRPELSGSISYYFSILHEYTTQSLSGCVTINDKIQMNIW